MVHKMNNFIERISQISSPTVQPNILIVDDRTDNLLATEKVLKKLDATIFKATSGNEALSLMLRHEFAIVLLDVQMPEMDGFETAKIMKEQESMRDVPIIFVTAISKEEKYASQAAEIGAVDYIFKPINPDILRSKVKVYLDIYVQHKHILKLNEGLTESYEELERFFFICSHDMQEPVRMMNTYAGLLEEKHTNSLDKESIKYLQFITSNAERLQKMILDILNFSRVGQIEVKQGFVDCNQILNEVLTELEPLIKTQNAQIVCDHLPILETFPYLIHLLLQNLISNGLKFQDRTKKPEIKIKALEQGTIWKFIVEDNGIGIEPIFHDRVFTIFQRGHRKEDYPGSGIGLSTCNKVLKFCGGTIEFKSKPGKGSIFSFTIPAKSQQDRGNNQYD